MSKCHFAVLNKAIIMSIWHKKYVGYEFDNRDAEQKNSKNGK